MAAILHTIFKKSISWIKRFVFESYLTKIFSLWKFQLAMIWPSTGWDFGLITNKLKYDIYVAVLQKGKIRLFVAGYLKFITSYR